MKVFITGGSGYIGQVVIEALLRHGHEVTALARSDRAVGLVTARGAKAVVGELTDAAVLREAAGAADGVLHLGASGERSAEVDRAAADALLDGLDGRGTYVHTGGVWVYGDTDGVVGEDAVKQPPAITAWRLENEARVLETAARGWHPVVVMPALVYGRASGLIETFFVEPARARGAVGLVGDGSNSTTLVHVDDLAELYVLALEKAPAGVEYVGVAENRTFAELAPALAAAAGVQEVRALANAAEEVGPIAEAFGLDQRMTSERARRELGWVPKHLDAVRDLANGS
ncbi:NAD-dependent epimerase/dehydratase family protein [Kribbella sp. NPDC051770]|uniref:NAD-dependent epimerase/dehydratase family protein n=1 Tax=Kribbella sp. NPDC051770 TaxID=3155413 RepID=UPI00343C668F